MSHRLAYVIGPSGAGKDSVLHGLRINWPLEEPAHWARRTITRPVKADDEQHEAVDSASFEQMRQAHLFAMHWQANGLSYGIRQTELAPLDLGHWVFVNGSRAYLPQLLLAFPEAKVVHITASHDVLAQRLAQRGRESQDAIAQRLSRAVELDLPSHVITINNNALLADAVKALLQALQMSAQKMNEVESNRLDAAR